MKDDETTKKGTLKKKATVTFYQSYKENVFVIITG